MWYKEGIAFFFSDLAKNNYILDLYRTVMIVWISLFTSNASFYNGRNKTNKKIIQEKNFCVEQ